MKDIFFIAELGINHNGDIDIAKEMIKMAKECGVDAVKFQKRTVDKIISKHMLSIKKNTPWGILNYIDYKKKLELNRSEYNEIDSYCKEIDIEWFASSWDIDSQKFLNHYNLNYNKVASAILTNIPLLKYIANQKKMTFISTGMSTWDDIDKAVNIFNLEECPFILMHCVGLYPCPDDNLNINMINTLKNRYDCEVGYSSHSSGILDTSIAATLGVKYIEKHITLESSMWGSDQSASLERKGLEYVVRDANLINKILGDGKRREIKQEKINAKNLRYWE